MRARVRPFCASAAFLWFVCAALAVPPPAAAQDGDPHPQQAPRAGLEDGPGDAGVVPGAVQDGAQDSETPPPGHVSAFEGTARLEREGEVSDVEHGMPVVPGDRVRTEAGRLEVTLADGSVLHLDRYSEIDWTSDLVVRLGRGRVLVTLAGNAQDRLSVEAPGALVRFDSDGQYRISVGGEDVVSVELAVIRGSAELANDAGARRLAAGQRSMVQDGSGPTAAEWFNAAGSSTLERWADERLSAAYTGPTASSTYLPSELDTYSATFDRYGSWQTDSSYGSVWYPTVAVDWRPYNHGRWSHMRRYGWTWVAHDPWGYPTHHYGRWQLSGRGSWFWIPSRRWGPAWVYWATTPTYVGWCPLGWNGRPVVNVFSYGGGRSYRGRDPYRAWTVSAVGAFGRPGRYHVDRRLLDRDRPSFVMQHVAPGFAPQRRPGYRTADGRGWGAPVRRPGVTGSTGSWRSPSRGPSPGNASRGDSSRGDSPRGDSSRGNSSRGSWGDPARGSAGSSWGDPARGNRNPPTAARPGGYASPRVTDPGPADSPYERARQYSDPNGNRSDPRGADRERSRSGPSTGDDRERSPYGRYSAPRSPDRGSDEGNDRGRSYGARPGAGSRSADAPNRSGSGERAPRPGISGPSDRGQAAPRGRAQGDGGGDGGGGRGDRSGRASGGDRSGGRSGDSGSRGASPRRRP